MVQSAKMILFIMWCLLLPTGTALAESCDTNCHDQCRVKTDFPPVNFVEPTCHAKCEIAKKAACAMGQSIPTIPITPREQVEVFGDAACGSIYYGIVNSVIAQCSNWNGRLDGQNRIEEAKGLLVGTGLFAAQEFNGVQIRFCPLQNAQGIAPEGGRIYLNTGMMNASLADLASLLGHEMVHIRQHRGSRAGAFACDYSRQFTECGGCQDDRHPMEHSAYQWERENRSRLAMSFTPPPAQICVYGPGQFCPMGMAIPSGSQCTCATPMGFFSGIAQ